MGPRNFVIAILLAIALAAGIFAAVRLQAPIQYKSAFVLPAPTPLPDFSLIDQSGNAVTADTFRNEWSLVFFGFTHCPDICPTTLQTLSKARSELAVAGQEPLPRVVLVSVDPERDTVELMRQYVDYFGDDNLGVTGSLEELQKLTTGLGIFFEKRPLNDDDYTVDHSSAVLLINPDGDFHALFSGPHTIDVYVHDIPLVMGSS